MKTKGNGIRINPEIFKKMIEGNGSRHFNLLEIVKGPGVLELNMQVLDQSRIGRGRKVEFTVIDPKTGNTLKCRSEIIYLGADILAPKDDRGSGHWYRFLTGCAEFCLSGADWLCSQQMYIGVYSTSTGKGYLLSDENLISQIITGFGGCDGYHKAAIMAIEW